MNSRELKIGLQIYLQHMHPMTIRNQIIKLICVSESYSQSPPHCASGPGPTNTFEDSLTRIEGLGWAT